MKVSGKVLTYGCFLLLTVSVIAGCFNIFGFATDKEKDPVAKAEEEIRGGNYSKAKDELQEYIDNDTNDSMILYTYAKASLLDAGLDLGTIVDLVQGETDVQSGFNNPILDKIDDLSQETQTAWYQSNTDVAKLLKKIYSEKSSGLFTKEDIALDYTISNVMSSILGLRDTNQDGIIDYTTDVQLDLISFAPDIGGGQDVEGFVLGNIKKDEQGNPVIDPDTQLPENTGLTLFLGGWSAKTAKTAIASEGEQTPDDINKIISFILTKLDEGEESIMFLINLYAGDNKEASSIDYDDIKGYIFDIGKFVNYYWYDDGEDNDGDGRTDEETIDGEDNDGDGLIDEDSDYHEADQTASENTEYHSLWQSWDERKRD
ncbi:hypothetical protein ACFL30_02325 [Candidatus Latescibacterota bacterium]